MGVTVHAVMKPAVTIWDLSNEMAAKERLPPRTPSACETVKHALGQYQTPSGVQSTL